MEGSVCPKKPPAWSPRSSATHSHQLCTEQAANWWLLALPVVWTGNCGSSLKCFLVGSILPSSLQILVLGQSHSSSEECLCQQDLPRLSWSLGPLSKLQHSKKYLLRSQWKILCRAFFSVLSTPNSDCKLLFRKIRLIKIRTFLWIFVKMLFEALRWRDFHWSHYFSYKFFSILLFWLSTLISCQLLPA